MAAILNSLWKSWFRTSKISPIFYQRISLTITHRCSSKSKEQEEPNKHEQERCFGINYLKDGTDPPLLPDNEYPDWLWKLTEFTKATEESQEQNAAYWKKINKRRRRQENEIRKQKKV